MLIIKIKHRFILRELVWLLQDDSGSLSFKCHSFGMPSLLRVRQNGVRTGVLHFSFTRSGDTRHDFDFRKDDGSLNVSFSHSRNC